MRCYVSGPMRLGHWHQNTRQAIDAAEALLNAGITPVVPQLSFFWDLVYAHPVEDWLKMDMELVEVCHCLLRLPGESEGADKEVGLARKLMIPVFYSVPEVLHWHKEHYALHRGAQSGTA